MSLQHAILVLLESDDASGYDLLKRFNGSMGHFWHASHQQIYQQLKKMHAAGLIDCELQPQDKRPDRKVYRLTTAGREELLHWLSQPARPFKYNDALLVKLFGGHLLGDDDLAAEIHSHRELYEERLKTFLGIEQRIHQLPGDEQARWRLPYLTLRRGILEIQSWLRWADEVEQALDVDVSAENSVEIHPTA